MAHKLIALILLVAAMMTLTAQQNAPFRYSQCPDPVVCCVVPAPRRTQPVPGGTPTTVPDSAVNLFGAHVSNLNTPIAVATTGASIKGAAQPRGPMPRATGTANLFLNLTIGPVVPLGADGTRYLQFFNATAEPTPGSIPIGSSSWAIASQRDRDIDVGSGGGGSGWAFTEGIMACCSNDQKVFNPSSGCGFLLQYY